MYIEDYVNLENARELDKLGFRDGCYTFYSKSYDGTYDMLTSTICPEMYEEGDEMYLAPTLYQSTLWLIKHYKIIISVKYSNYIKKYYAVVSHMEHREEFTSGYSEDYAETLNNAISETIKLINKK